FETRPDCRDICPEAPGPGAADAANSSNTFRQTGAARRDGRDRSRAHLYDAARCEKTRCGYDNIGGSRRLSQGFADPGRGDVVDKRIEILLLAKVLELVNGADFLHYNPHL